MWSGAGRVELVFARDGDRLLINGEGVGDWPTDDQLARWTELLSWSGSRANRVELRANTQQMYRSFFAGVLDGYTALPRTIVMIVNDYEVDVLPFEAASLQFADGAPVTPLVDEVNLLRAFRV